MSEFNISINLDSFTSNNERITGIIFINTEKNIYPDVGWNDFPVIILTWWGTSIIENNDEFYLGFMDGPFWIKMRKKDSVEVEMDFIQRGLKDKKLFTIQTKYEDLVYSIMNSIEKVIIFCEKKQWESKDLNDLKRTYELLVDKYN